MPFTFERFERSSTRGKKYDAILTDPEGRVKRIPFGSRMEHYKDTTGLGIYSNLDHLDEGRRESYLARSGGIRDGEGKLTKDNPFSANYYARRFLWSSRE